MVFLFFFFNHNWHANSQHAGETKRKKKRRRERTRALNDTAGKIENGKKHRGDTLDQKSCQSGGQKEKQRRYSGAEISMRPACQKQAGTGFCGWRVCTFYGGYSDIRFDERGSTLDDELSRSTINWFGRLTAMPGNNMVSGK